MIEATGNAAAVAEVLSPYVDRIVIANPKQVHMIAHAKVKTDTIDATVLAKLYASGFLPEVWVPDTKTLALRRQVTRRIQLVRQRSRLKNSDPVYPPRPPDPTVSAWQSLRNQRTQMACQANTTSRRKGRH